MIINLNRLFSLFKRKKKLTGENMSLESFSLSRDMVINCCEQMGAFENLNIEEENLINQISDEIVRLFNSGERSKESLKEAFIQGFKNCSFDVKSRSADLFVDCYMESYVYCN